MSRFEESAPVRQEDRSETMRRRLVAVAGELFAERGFGDTSIEDIVRRAGVTRGALYHHFDSKRDIFLAVYDAAEQRMIEGVANVSLAAPDAWTRLRAGCHAFLDACLEPAFQQIALRDGPAVLGWETWRELDARYGLGLIEQGFEAAMAEGHLRARPTGVLAHLVMGALTEAAMLIARAEHPRRARASVTEEIDALLDGMRDAPSTAAATRAPSRTKRRRKTSRT